jgi:hypothetical protein
MTTLQVPQNEGRVARMVLPFVLAIAIGVVIAAVVRWLEFGTLAALLVLAAGVVPAAAGGAIFAFGPYDDEASGQRPHSRAIPF